MNEEEKNIYATTFEEYETSRQLDDMFWDTLTLTDTFSYLMDNIMMSSSVLGTEATKVKLSALFDDFKNRLTELSELNLKVVSSKGSATVLQNKSGENFFYGIYTNAFYDREGEVLTGESHKEFLDFLNDNPDEAPQLWSFHQEGTARKSRAVWWDFSENLVQMLWPLTEVEADEIIAFSKQYTPGMSHGFYVLDKEGDKIKQYRTFEASILPLEFAANPYTNFTIEGEKMFSDEKRSALVAMHGEEFVAKLEEQNEKMADVTDKLEAVVKEIEDGGEDLTSSDLTSSQPEAEQFPEDIIDGEDEGDDAVTALNSRLESLEEIVLAQQETIAAQSDQLKYFADKTAAIAKGQSKYQKLADMLGGKTTVGSSKNRLLSTEPLARKQPAETAPEEETRGLASFFPTSKTIE